MNYLTHNIFYALNFLFFILKLKKKSIKYFLYLKFFLKYKVNIIINKIHIIFANKKLNF